MGVRVVRALSRSERDGVSIHCRSAWLTAVDTLDAFIANYEMTATPCRAEDAFSFLSSMCAFLRPTFNCLLVGLIHQLMAALHCTGHLASQTDIIIHLSNVHVTFSVHQLVPTVNSVTWYMILRRKYTASTMQQTDKWQKRDYLNYSRGTDKGVESALGAVAESIGFRLSPQHRNTEEITDWIRVTNSL